MKKKLSLGLLGLFALGALASAIPANAQSKKGGVLCNYFGACPASPPKTPGAPGHPPTATPTPTVSPSSTSTL